MFNFQSLAGDFFWLFHLPLWFFKRLVAKGEGIGCHDFIAEKALQSLVEVLEIGARLHRLLLLVDNTQAPVG